MHPASITDSKWANVYQGMYLSVSRNSIVSINIILVKVIFTVARRFHLMGSIYLVVNMRLSFLDF